MIEPNTNVTWTHVTRSGGGLTMEQRRGVVEAIVGDVATVRKPSGHRERVAVSRLRTAGQQSQIAEFVEAIKEART